MKREVTAPAALPASTAPEQGNRAMVYLHAGELVATAAPTAITTVLGSCVAVCLYDPARRI
ncbi:MAG TPA: hypothetical protein VLT61_06590, partial [Anaeromyxobacteraceae bacterium]|nr:hypothetical protein [Anaeromyxobacteraceae bacterium]